MMFVALRLSVTESALSLSLAWPFIAPGRGVGGKILISSGLASSSPFVLVTGGGVGGCCCFWEISLLSGCGLWCNQSGKLLNINPLFDSKVGRGKAFPEKLHLQNALKM